MIDNKAGQRTLLCGIFSNSTQDSFSDGVGNPYSIGCSLTNAGEENVKKGLESLDLSGEDQPDQGRNH